MPQWISEVFLDRMCANQLIFAESFPGFSTCTDASIVISSRFKTSSCHLTANSLVTAGWIKLAALIPRDELEDDYAAQFCKGFGAPAKPFRMALGALIVKTRLNLTDEELVEQIKEHPYLKFFIGLEAFQFSAPSDPSMMVSFRKRLPESVVNNCNERIVRHGLNVIQSAESEIDENDGHDSGIPSHDRPLQPDSDHASSNPGTLLMARNPIDGCHVHPSRCPIPNGPLFTQ